MLPRYLRVPYLRTIFTSPISVVGIATVGRCSLPDAGVGALLDLAVVIAAVGTAVDENADEGFAVGATVGLTDVFCVGGLVIHVLGAYTVGDGDGHKLGGEGIQFIVGDCDIDEVGGKGIQLKEGAVVGASDGGFVKNNSFCAMQVKDIWAHTAK